VVVGKSLLPVEIPLDDVTDKPNQFFIINGLMPDNTESLTRIH
jgi:hypothetical protein